MRALLPAGILLLVGLWSGTFWYGASPAAAAAGHLALLAAAAVAAPGRDPLRLGRWWPLPWALLAVMAASLALSPVPRAGYLAVLLFAPLLAWSAVAAVAAGEEGRFAAGVAVAVGLTAVPGLLELAAGVGRAALPLGHHLLLGVWLVVLLPLAAVPLLRGGAESPRSMRALAVIALVLGLAALVGTRSIAAAAGVALAALVLAPRRRRGWALAVGALALLPLGGRLAAMAAARDVSLLARLGYWRAALEGWCEAPLLGHGPSAVPWTVSLHLQPLPGIHPPGEIVGDVHSLPLQLLYELGLGGALAAAGVAVALLRRPAGSPPPSPVERAGRAGLAGGLVALAGGVTLGTLAPWVALATAAGASRAGLPVAPVRRVWPWRLLAVGVAVALLPLHLAAARWETARAVGEGEAARRALAAAMRWDPGFPLYRTYAAWSTEGEAAAALARQGAVRAQGVGTLWLAAAALAPEAGAAEALRRACELDPLGALPPHLLALVTPDDEAAAALAARALLAAPQLAASLDWDVRPRVLELAAARVARQPGVDAGWRDAFRRAAATLPPPGGTTSRLVLTTDGDASTALSLFAFRRRPWPAEVAAVAIWDDRAAHLAHLPSAATLATTDPEVFAGGCGR